MKKENKIIGIVTEYNPLHKGHIHHIKEIKKLYPESLIIAAMSPNFVQRGEPALVNKWVRTEHALDCGVDIVVEIPSFFVLQSADIFAKAAVHILHHMKVDTIIFGSERNSIVHDQSFDKGLIQQGFSYAASFNRRGLKSNDVLGQAYAKHARKFGIKCETIQRIGSEHLDDKISSTMPSASAIRRLVEGNMLEQAQKYTIVDLKDNQLHLLKDYEIMIQYALISQTKHDLSKIHLIDEGIENLFIKKSHLKLSHIIKESTSRRYTGSRIQRSLMQILLNNQKDEYYLPSHSRVLGFNNQGRIYLKKLDPDRYTSQFKNYELKELELKASRIYALPFNSTYQEKTIKNEIAQIIIKK